MGSTLVISNYVIASTISWNYFEADLFKFCLSLCFVSLFFNH